MMGVTAKSAATQKPMDRFVPRDDGKADGDAASLRAKRGNP